MAEMTVDPRADNSNPEVCDPCGPNCQSTVVDFFRIDGSYLGSQQWPTQPPYSFDSANQRDRHATFQPFLPRRR